MAGNFIRDSVTHTFTHQILTELLLGASRHPRHWGYVLEVNDVSFFFSRSYMLDEVIASAANTNSASFSG